MTLFAAKNSRIWRFAAKIPDPPPPPPGGVSINLDPPWIRKTLAAEPLWRYGELLGVLCNKMCHFWLSFPIYWFISVSPLSGVGVEWSNIIVDVRNLHFIFTIVCRIWNSLFQSSPSVGLYLDPPPLRAEHLETPPSLGERTPNRARKGGGSRYRPTDWFASAQPGGSIWRRGTLRENCVDPRQDSRNRNLLQCSSMTFRDPNSKISWHRKNDRESLVRSDWQFHMVFGLHKIAAVIYYWIICLILSKSIQLVPCTSWLLSVGYWATQHPIWLFNCQRETQG